MDASSSGFSPWDHSLHAPPRILVMLPSGLPRQRSQVIYLCSPMILTWTGFLEKAHGAETVFH